MAAFDSKGEQWQALPLFVKVPREQPRRAPSITASQGSVDFMSEECMCCKRPTYMSMEDDKGIWTAVAEDKKAVPISAGAVPDGTCRGPPQRKV